MHLHVVEPQNPAVISLFWALVRDARLAARRDLDSSTPLEPPHEHPGQGIWSAALLYMVLCDQIGTAVEPLGAQALPPDISGFKRALIYFGRRVEKLSDQDLDTLYALRCSFAHDYSLINRPEPQKVRARMSRLFALTWGVERPLVQDPNPLWDGDLANLPAERTFVNLRAFEELVEAIVADIQPLSVRLT